MRYIAPLINFGGVRCGLFVGLARLNDLLQMTVTKHDIPTTPPFFISDAIQRRISLYNSSYIATLKKIYITEI